MTSEPDKGNHPPRHVAIIMDGNGRWAKARGLDRIEGHFVGVERVRSSVKAALAQGVGYLTIYAFSTENWGRPQEEVEGLMALFCKCVLEEVPELVRQGVRVEFIGDIEALDDDVKQSVGACIEKTSAGDKLRLIVALNYSSRSELSRAAMLVSAKVAKGTMTADEVTPEVISENLYTSDYPDPDLIIRTGGEFRLSNFMLWQGAYSELYFTSVMWPDFDEKEFEKAVNEYKLRTRRFGLI